MVGSMCDIILDLTMSYPNIFWTCESCKVENLACEGLEDFPKKIECDECKVINLVTITGYQSMYGYETEAKKS